MTWCGLVLVAIALFAPFLVFIAYPGLLWLRTRVAPSNDSRTAGRGMPLEGTDHSRDVSIVVAVRNGEALIEDKLANSRGLRWPHGSVQVVVASDGSTDGTRERLDRDRGQDLTVLEFPDHVGKARALNAAAAAATGEFLVFSDADARLDEGALEALLAPFDDRAVGGVCGRRVLQEENVALEDAQQSYVDWDSSIKAWESRLGSLTSNDGKLYAVRRSLFEPIAEGVTDDLYSALGVIVRGARFVFAPEARARVRVPSRSRSHELERRRRIVCRSLRGLWQRRALFNPTRYGGYSVALAINKGVRRLLPLALLAGLAGSLLLAVQWPLLWAVPALLMLGILSAWMPRMLPEKPRILRRTGRLSQYALIGGWGTLLGCIDFVRGRKVVTWDPKKGESAARQKEAGGLRVAYVMSRFPRITETFVLSEIVGLMDRGVQIDVFPLWTTRETVVHPDVERVRAHVHPSPLTALPVWFATARTLAHSPVMGVRTVWGALAANVRSWNHFCGALATLPKAFWIAEQVKERGIHHVHAHFATHPALCAWVVGQLVGRPFSFTAHGSDLHVDQVGLAHKARDAQFVVSISRYNLEFLATHCGPWVREKTRVVHCSPHPSFFADALADLGDRSERAASATPLRILCVAALRGVKGHRFLFDACALLKERGVPFTCECVGDGPLREDLSRRIRTLELGDCVSLSGTRPRDQVRARMLDADVVVLPSIQDAKGRREGIPVTLMEAMLCEKPVISSRQSGIPELVEHGVHGLLVTPGDAEELSVALESMARSPEQRQRFGQAARERVLRDFHPDRSLDRLHQLFTASIDDQSAAPPNNQQVQPKFLPQREGSTTGKSLS